MNYQDTLKYIDDINDEIKSAVSLDCNITDYMCYMYALLEISTTLVCNLEDEQ
jgi:hypothetical protein